MAWEDGRPAIHATLLYHLEQFPDLPRLAVENEDFTPGQSEVYLTTSFQPNKSPDPGIGFDDPQGLRGIFQISVLYPEGKSAEAPSNLAEKLAKHFAPRAEPLSIAGAGLVRIVDHPVVGGGLQQKNDSRYMIPVTVPWVVW
jgi:hypothetical protein